MSHFILSYFIYTFYIHYPVVDIVAFHLTSVLANKISPTSTSWGLISYFSHLSAINAATSDTNGIGPYLEKGLIGLGAGSATAGCLGAGIGQGFSAGKAAEAIGRNPEATDKVRTIMIIGAAIAESGAIYSLLVAIILLFVFK